MSRQAGQQWPAVGAVASAGTVAATIFCCLPFASGIVGAGVAAFGAQFTPLDHLLDLVTMRNPTRRRPLLTTLAVALMMVGLYADPAPIAQTTGRAALQDLRGLDELKTMFNQDAGRVKLVLLLSPT